MKNTLFKWIKINLHIKQNNIFSHIKNYFLSSVFTKFLAFISIPIFTRLLGPEGYGAIGLFTSITAIVAIVSSFGVDSSVKRYYYEENINQREFLGANLIYVTVFNLLLLITLYVFSDIIVKLTSIPLDILFLGLIVGILFAYKSIVFGVWQSKKKSGLIGKTSVASGIITLIISVFLVIRTGTYFGQIYGYLFGGIIITVVLLFNIRNDIKFNIKFEYLKYSLFLGIPLVINQLAGFILSFFDRIILNKYFGLIDVGIYSFAYNISMVMEMVIYSINSAWIPIMFEKMKNETEDELQIYFELFSKIIFLAATALILFSSEIASVLADERYSRALPIIPVVIFGYVFKFMYTFYSNIEYYHKKTKALAFFSIMASVVNIILNIIFVPNYGVIAAAYTTTASYVLLFLFHLYFVSKILRFKYLDLTKIFYPFLSMVVITIGFQIFIFNYGSSNYLLVVKLLLILVLTYVYFIDKRYMKNS